MTSTVETPEENIISQLFSNLSQPARIQILLVVREQESCVCHLMAALGLRQASISQHLMALRELGWVKARRDGRLIYYSLADQRLVGLIEQAAAIANISLEEIEKLSRRPLENCPCPQCHPELPPEYSCKSLPPGYPKKLQNG
jgi:DNA-binding transcriptional ArsR family regulator